MSVGRGRRLGAVSPTAAAAGLESGMIRSLSEDLGVVGAIGLLDSGGVALDAGMSEEGSTGIVRAFLAGRPIGEVGDTGRLCVWCPFGPVRVVGITGRDWEVRVWPFDLFKSGEEVRGVMDEGGVEGGAEGMGAGFCRHCSGFWSRFGVDVIICDEGKEGGRNDVSEMFAILCTVRVG